ncbi:molybdenum cofactor biosynthesis protein [Skermanella stibiiresistens SB22]|uniref:Molybdenum cofactor biosynthesis protein n=1 Tax=Skermanella stibiiresistens SB22 TaxID=1385369 RepID=W9H552_9PROT|nr:molybdopterin-binding protein [Skermanella stibiiresistens]EWY39832.1 molybdenum cofactor biosynthesis protein [Skermanella stibiiresistens SB22]
MTQLSEEAEVTAALLIIGNEILSGRTKDANLPFLAEKLNGIGVRLREARVVPDIEAEIIDAVNALRARYTYVFTTGGIGPTHDDITSECVAKAFGVALERNPEAVGRLQAHYQTTEINEARLRMANIPAGGILIDNPVSKAPGFQIGNVFVMAGVPMIMQGMLESLLPRLRGGAPMLARTVSCDLAEGTLAEGLGATQGRYPEIEIGSYPYLRNKKYGVSLVLRGTEEARLDEATQAVARLVRDLGGEPSITIGYA